MPGGRDAVDHPRAGLARAASRCRAARRAPGVFCEKPLAYTTAEVDELIGREPAVPPASVLLGYMKQYDPAVVAARALLAGIDDVPEALT